MKKPVILLVDDEPAVLAALEAELAPRFGEIARIEAFAQPARVFEEFPRWREEKRALAVAIVDQKMPEMSGVEFLSRLRAEAAAGGGESHPAAHLNGILLTGYAALDSAVAAKNEAGADRYIEKPWGSRGLREATASLLRSSLAAAGRLRWLQQAVARDPDVLRRIFKLRYDVYRSAPYAQAFLRPNADGAFLDGFDRKGMILELLLFEGDEKRLVGTMRLTTREESRELDAVRSAAALLPDVGRDLEQPIAAPFPILADFVGQEREVLLALIEDLERGGARVAEPGRHAVLPEHRRGGTDRCQLEGTVAFCIAHGIDHAICDVPVSHRRFYPPFGFEAVSGVGRNPRESALTPIWSSVSRIWPDVRPRIDALVDRLDSGEEFPFLCFCPTYPTCIPGPYATGDFRATDVFCPRVAEFTLAGLAVRCRNS